MLRKLLLIIVIIMAISSVVFAQLSTSSNYILKNAKIIVSGSSASSTNYRLDKVEIGNAYGGKAQSTNYILDTRPGADEKRPPNPPTLNPLISPTNNPTQTISGRKDRATSIYINGWEFVPLNDNTTWSCSITLVEGVNYLIITARNIYNLESSSIQADIFLDTSPPTTPMVTDGGIFTTSLTQLSASWNAEDTQTGIAEYQYAIGTLAFGTDVVGWTSASTQTEITHSALTLIQGQSYYISVKAKNGAGSWSQIGSSDGIKVNQTIPQILAIQPANDSTGYTDTNINLSVNASDQDGDSLVYQFSINGQIAQTWQSSSNFSWSTAGARLGINSIRIEASDNNGGLVSQEINLFLFRKPPAPPSS